MRPTLAQLTLVIMICAAFIIGLRIKPTKLYEPVIFLSFGIGFVLTEIGIDIFVSIVNLRERRGLVQILIFDRPIFRDILLPVGYSFIAVAFGSGIHQLIQKFQCR